MCLKHSALYSAVASFPMVCKLVVAVRASRLEEGKHESADDAFDNFGNVGGQMYAPVVLGQIYTLFLI